MEGYDKTVIITSLEKRHSEERKTVVNIMHLADIKMLDTVMDFAKMTLKGVFVLNGMAAISMLTLFTKALIDKPDISYGILYSTIPFAIGALLSSIASSCGYATQLNYQQKCAYDYANVLVEISTGHLKEQENYVKTFTDDEWENVESFFNDLRSPLVNKLTENKIKSDKSETKGNRWRIGAVILIISSYVAFFSGIALTVYSFNI